MKNIIVVLLVFFMFSDCKERKNTTTGIEKPASPKEKGGAMQAEEKNAARAHAVVAATQQYGIQYCWDTLNTVRFTAYEKLNSSGIQLVTDYDINLFYEYDSVYHLVISCGSMREYNLKLDLRKELLTVPPDTTNSDAGIILPGYPALLVRVDDFKREFLTGTGKIIALIP